ncbi:hypothetical protein PMIN03_009896 [Paraphaeosphaeria minitans]
MGLRSWLRSHAKQMPANMALGKLDADAALKEKQIVESKASISATTVRAHTDTASLDESSADILLDPHPSNCSASSMAKTQIADSIATPPVDVSPDNASDMSFVIIDVNDEETALDPARRLNSSAELSTEEQMADSNPTSAADILPDDGNIASHPLSYSDATLVDQQTVDSDTAPSEDFLLDSGSVWSFEIIDEEYVTKHGLTAPNEAHADAPAPSVSEVPLTEYNHVDKDAGETKGVAEDAEESAEEDEVDGRPLLSNDTSTADNKRVTDDAVLPSDIDSNPDPPNGASNEVWGFDDKEIPLKEDADTFIIPRLKYPSERNGALKDELAAAVRTPVATAARAGGAAKQMAEAVLAPRALKRAFDNVKGTVADGVANYLNAVTAGYDVPEIAGCIIEPIIAIKDRMPTQEVTDKLVDQATDKAQALFGMGKMRRFAKTDPLNASGMAYMVDAYRVFAHEMCREALQALVDDGICHKWQINGDRPILKCRCLLEQALATFYLQHKQNMQPEELMAAVPSWFVDKKNGCFTLKLFAMWKVYDDPDVGSRSEFLATNFTLPEALCKMSTASVCADPAPMTKKKGEGEPDDGIEDADVILHDVEDSDRTDENEDDGVVWLDDEDSEGDDE